MLENHQKLQRKGTSLNPVSPLTSLLKTRDEVIVELLLLGPRSVLINGNQRRESKMWIKAPLQLVLVKLLEENFEVNEVLLYIYFG